MMRVRLGQNLSSLTVSSLTNGRRFETGEEEERASLVLTVKMQLAKDFRFFTFATHVILRLF